jgi:hypothetical protein
MMSRQLACHWVLVFEAVQLYTPVFHKRPFGVEFLWLALLGYLGKMEKKQNCV